jgi:hypothetical protein
MNSPLNTNGEGNISAYSESATDGTLTLLSGSPYNTGLPTSGAVIVDQAMNLLFAIGGAGSGQPTGEIVEYAISPTTGALSAMTTTTPPDIPTSLAIGPSGKFLYVTSHTSSAVTGALTQVSSTPISPGANANGPAGLSMYKKPQGKIPANHPPGGRGASRWPGRIFFRAD